MRYYKYLKVPLLSRSEYVIQIKKSIVNIQLVSAETILTGSVPNKNSFFFHHSIIDHYYFGCKFLKIATGTTAVPFDPFPPPFGNATREYYYNVFELVSNARTYGVYNIMAMR